MMNIKKFYQFLAIKNSAFMKVMHVFCSEYLHAFFFFLVTEYWGLEWSIDTWGEELMGNW